LFRANPSSFPPEQRATFEKILKRHDGNKETLHNLVKSKQKPRTIPGGSHVQSMSEVLQHGAFISPSTADSGIGQLETDGERLAPPQHLSPGISRSASAASHASTIPDEELDAMLESEHEANEEEISALFESFTHEDAARVLETVESLSCKAQMAMKLVEEGKKITDQLTKTHGSSKKLLQSIKEIDNRQEEVDAQLRSVRKERRDLDKQEEELELSRHQCSEERKAATVSLQSQLDEEGVQMQSVSKTLSFLGETVVQVGTVAKKLTNCIKEGSRKREDSAEKEIREIISKTALQGTLKSISNFSLNKVQALNLELGTDKNGDAAMMSFMKQEKIAPDEVENVFAGRIEQAKVK
jgi:hypothetical protein